MKKNYRINHAHLHTVPNYSRLHLARDVLGLRVRNYPERWGTLQSIETNQTSRFLVYDFEIS